MWTSDIKEEVEEEKPSPASERPSEVRRAWRASCSSASCEAISTSPWRHLATSSAAWPPDEDPDLALWIKLCMSLTVPMQIIPRPTPSDRAKETKGEPGPASIISTIFTPWPCRSEEEERFERLGRVVRGGKRSVRGIF